MDENECNNETLLMPSQTCHKCLVLQFMKMPLDSTEKVLQHQIFSDSTLTLAALKY